MSDDLAGLGSVFWRKKHAGEQRGSIQDPQSGSQKLRFSQIFMDQEGDQKGRTEIVDKTDQIFCLCFRERLLLFQVAHHFGSHGVAEEISGQDRIAAVDGGTPDQPKQGMYPFQQNRNRVCSYQ